MGEIWKDINETYAVSSYGRVKSKDKPSKDKSNRLKVVKGRILKPGVREDKYFVVNISGYKHKKHWKIHQLVAQHFIPNPNNYKIINHIDGNPQNNKVDNLEWCTQKHNCLHAYKTGLSKPVVNKGLKNGFSKQVIDFNTGVFYESLSEVASLYGYRRGTLGAMLSGQNKNKTQFKFI